MDDLKWSKNQTNSQVFRNILYNNTSDTLTNGQLDLEKKEISPHFNIKNTNTGISATQQPFIENDQTPNNDTSGKLQSHGLDKQAQIQQIVETSIR